MSPRRGIARPPRPVPARRAAPTRTDRTSWLALGLAVVSLVASLAQYCLTYRQAERIAEQSGPVLLVKSALQLASADGRTARRITEEEHPTVGADTLGSYGTVDLVLTVTNIGREDTTVLDAELTAGPGRAATGVPQTLPKITPTRCANPGGDEVGCSAALPHRLAPGSRYYLTFPLRPLRDRFAAVETSLAVDVAATGVRDGHSVVSTGVVVDLRPKTPPKTPPQVPDGPDAPRSDDSATRVEEPGPA